MLVLSRRVGEKILIGGNVEIVVLAASADRASIGIDAPDDVVIRRAETVNAIPAASLPPEYKNMGAEMMALEAAVAEEMRRPVTEEPIATIACKECGRELAAVTKTNGTERWMEVEPCRRCIHLEA